MKKYLKNLKERIRDNKQKKQEAEMSVVYKNMFQYSRTLQAMNQRIVAKRILIRQHRGL